MGTSEDKLKYLNETKEEIRLALNDKGLEIKSEDTFRSYAPKIKNMKTTKPKLQDKTVVPNIYTQDITADEEFDGLGTVSVEAVNPDIDIDIQPETIKSGVDILGVIGTFTNDATIEPNDILKHKMGYKQGEQINGAIDYDVIIENAMVTFEVNQSTYSIMDYHPELNLTLSGFTDNKSISINTVINGNIEGGGLNSIKTIYTPYVSSNTTYKFYIAAFARKVNADGTINIMIASQYNYNSSFSRVYVPEYRLYRFNPKTKDLTYLGYTRQTNAYTGTVADECRIYPHPTNPNIFAIASDGGSDSQAGAIQFIKYVGTNELERFEFAPTSNTDTVDASLDCQWSPDGKYVLVLNNNGMASTKAYIYNYEEQYEESQVWEKTFDISVTWWDNEHYILGSKICEINGHSIKDISNTFSELGSNGTAYYFAPGQYLLLGTTARVITVDTETGDIKRNSMVTNYNTWAGSSGNNKAYNRSILRPKIYNNFIVWKPASEYFGNVYHIHSVGDEVIKTLYRAGITYESGIDANATPSDLVSGKIAYANGEKIIGNIGESQSGYGIGLLCDLVELLYSGSSLKIKATFNYDQLMRSGSYMETLVDIDTVADVINLQPEQIVQGNTVLGIKGTTKVEKDLSKITIEDTESIITVLETSKISGYNFEFELNNSGFYESTNKAINNSKAGIAIKFNASQDTIMTISFINYAESNWDYGTIYALDDDSLSNTNALFKGKDSTKHSANIQTLDIEVTAGEHTLYATYVKDGSDNNNNDSFQIKIPGIPEKRIARPFIEDDELPTTDLSLNNISVIYNTEGDIISIKKYNGSDWEDYNNGTDTSDATATASDILQNKTAYVNGEKITGTLVSLNTSDATASAIDLAVGKTAYVNGEKITGTVQYYTGPTTEYTNHTGGSLISSDSYHYMATYTLNEPRLYRTGATIQLGIPLTDIRSLGGLTASKLLKGYTAFNIQGTATADATATAADIATGKTAYVNGNKLTGTGTIANDYYVKTPSPRITNPSNDAYFNWYSKKIIDYKVENDDFIFTIPFLLSGWDIINSHITNIMNSSIKIKNPQAFGVWANCKCASYDASGELINPEAITFNMQNKPNTYSNTAMYHMYNSIKAGCTRIVAAPLTFNDITYDVTTNYKTPMTNKISITDLSFMECDHPNAVLPITTAQPGPVGYSAQTVNISSSSEGLVVGDNTWAYLGLMPKLENYTIEWRGKANNTNMNIVLNIEQPQYYLKRILFIRALNNNRGTTFGYGASEKTLSDVFMTTEHTVHVTLDRSTKMMKLYVDGVLRITEDFNKSNYSRYDLPYCGIITIGEYNYSYNFIQTNNITKALHFFNRVLTDDEIVARHTELSN